MRTLVTCLALLLSLCVNAQFCGTDIIHEQRLKTDSSYAQAFRVRQQEWQDYASEKAAGKIVITPTDTIYEIPIVFHIMHCGEPIGHVNNPTDQQIIDLLEYVNKTFATQWASYPGIGSGGVKIPIRYVMAQRSLNCTPTTGIERIDARFIKGYEQYGVDYLCNPAQHNGAPCLGNVWKYNSNGRRMTWPEAEFYNVFLVNNIVDPPGSTVSAFAMMPAGGSALDFTMMEVQYAKAGDMVLVHELGHSLGLHHTFEGDSSGTTCPINNRCFTDGDGICDTEPHNRNFNSCNNGINPCTGNAINNTDRNFMSYSRTCHDRFTQGQKDRMLYNIKHDYNRASAIQSDAVLPFNIVAAGCTPNIVRQSLNNYGYGILSFGTMNFGHLNTPGSYFDYSCYGFTRLHPGKTYAVNFNGVAAGLNIKAYIDFNNDGNFNSTTELVMSVKNSNPKVNNLTSSIKIPATGVTLCTNLRMRIVCDTFNTPFPTPCDTPKAGKTNDYSVYLLPETLADVSIKQTTGTNPTCKDSMVGFTATVTGALPGYKLFWCYNTQEKPGGLVYNYDDHYKYGTIKVKMLAPNHLCAVSDTIYSNSDTIWYKPTGPVPVVKTYGYSLVSDVYPVHWYLENNTLIAANVTGSFVPPVTGKYYARNIATGCPSEKSNLIAGFSLGLNQIFTKTELHIYPNPTHGTCFIEVINNAIKRISITNSMGNVIASDNPASNKVILNTESWVGGIYFATVEYADGTREVRKLVVPK